jgi:hypothetical protein
MAAPALAQGTDQPPAERDAMVIAALLPGLWSNGEQVAFAARAREPATALAKLSIVAADGTLVVSGDEAHRWQLAQGADGRSVRMIDLAAPGACAIIWRRSAGEFSGLPEPGCKAGGVSWRLSPDRLWRVAADGTTTRFIRATQFRCYMDVPGVSGGRAIPFQRFEGLSIDDQGGEAEIVTQETPPRTLRLSLRKVDWPFNNAPGVYTRDSLVIYVHEVGAAGKTRTLSYAWTEPGARRIGINLMSVLANCYREAMNELPPEF